jgi:hypothetical protein
MIIIIFHLPSFQSCSLQHLNLRDDNLDLSALLLATRDSTFPALLFLDFSGKNVFFFYLSSFILS